MVSVDVGSANRSISMDFLLF